MSKQLLSNLTEFQAVWCKWLPNVYSQVNIHVDTIREEEHPKNGAICAFSGGVDATFSVWMHKQSKFGYRSQNIKLCSIVHGFDIPLKDKVAFNNTVKRSEETLADLGLEIKPIRTNYREITKVSWEHAFSSALVATLSNYKSLAGTCIVGSSEPYDSLVIPWGSSPITDHLLGSGDFIVMHDGASHSRTEKVKEISSWPLGLSNLRVCWEGDIRDRNCGKCEKCLRTQLNFLAVNAPIPTSFEPIDIIAAMKKIELKNNVIRAEWRQTRQYAKEHGIDDDWVKQIPKVIKRKPLIEKLLPQESRRRKSLKKVKNKVKSKLKSS
ncbi:hypothetical protein [Corallincola luteus]|uniref:hypothetical protein n=1 Tax=Corallincola luteus TaxID=1775177 RepID=UPI00196B5C4F|nr:hypothetical protein [Corallincola luteus]